MASPVPQFRIWDKAKGLSSRLKLDEALALYRSVETDFYNLQEWRTYKTAKDNAFDQAMFFGDYCGVLCDIGYYAEAKEKGDLALSFQQKASTNTLRYIYYNIGNIYLFQKDYAAACPWYERALDGEKLFYTKVNHYLVNYGVSLYFLGMSDKAEEKFRTAISASKDTKYNKSFEPFFYMSKICQSQNNAKESQRYRKMYLTRLKKYSSAEMAFAASTMEDKDEILADYQKERS
jgi:tetratricopeptide (TPR) repeat protein